MLQVGGGGGGGGGGDILVLLVCFEGLLTRPHILTHHIIITIFTPVNDS